MRSTGISVPRGAFVSRELPRLHWPAVLAGYQRDEIRFADDSEKSRGGPRRRDLAGSHVCDYCIQVA